MKTARRTHALKAFALCAGFGLIVFGDAASAAQASGAAVTRRLTPDQYRNVIADIFGPTIAVGGRFEPGIREEGLLAVGASKASMTSSGLEQYDSIARGIAAQVVEPSRRATFVPCKPANEKAPDDACTAQFVKKVGPLLFRRSLTDQEVATQVAVANAAAVKLGDFYSGIEMSLVGMLDSLPFLFRGEVAEADPKNAGQYRLDAISKASRLSFFLWDTKPDAELMEAAQKGDLDGESGLSKQVDRMLDSPRLEAGVRAFFTDMLQFDLFGTLAKDTVIFPRYTTRVATDAQEQTLRTIVDHLLVRKGDYRDLFTTRKTFLSPSLGSIYGVAVPKTVSGTWQPYEFPEGDPRAGILMQASFVALHSHPGRSSPTLRGKALRELILCQPVPPPPANVNFAVVEDSTNPNLKTVRDRLTAHRTDPSCAGCHRIMDPIGLSMENFDSAGGFRTVENGQPIDTSGDLDGVKFNDASGLAKAVHDNPATASCLVNRIYAYGIGRAVTRGEIETVKGLFKDFAADGYKFPDLLRRIATSDAFYRVAAPQMGANDTPAAKKMAGSENSQR